MSGRPRVLVAAGSETLVLRLRMMVEAEGAEAIVLDEGDAGDVRLVLTAPALRARATGTVPGVPVLELGDGEDWGHLHRRLSEALAVPASERDALADSLARARVLLVDDSVTFREYLRQELVRLGAAVSVCGTADAALARLAEGGWDCVLIDLVLPGVDGAELCSRAARLRRQGAGNFVLAVMSSREGKADLIRCLEAGADLFLGKAQDLALIRAKLGALLRRRALVG